MTVVVFSGPSLSESEVRRIIPQAAFRGPASQGDFLRALSVRPSAICLIDGYFEHVPAVTHKEILRALRVGTPVFGGASLGALRAAELCTLGMVGHGAIFEAYASGLLEDDDEVAVAHAGGEHGFAPASEPLVNIRATLRHAVVHGALGADREADLVAALKDVFYADRQRNTVHDLASRMLPTSEALALRTWLHEPGRWVDQKRLDAQSLIEHVRVCAERDELEVHCIPELPQTDAWLSLTSSVQEEGAAAAGQDAERVLTEIRLLGTSGVQACEAAASRRALCQALGAQLGVGPLGQGDMAALLPVARDAMQRELGPVLRELPAYGVLLQRSLRKHELRLAACDLPSPGEADWHYYFEARLGRSVPADLGQYAAGLGMHLDTFRSAVALELAFLRSTESAGE